MDLKQVISKKDKTIEKLRREVRSKISLVKEIQVKLLTLEKSSKKSNMQLRENIEDLQDENRKLIRETFDFSQNYIDWGLKSDILHIFKKKI